MLPHNFRLCSAVLATTHRSLPRSKLYQHTSSRARPSVKPRRFSLLKTSQVDEHWPAARAVPILHRAHAPVLCLVFFASPSVRVSCLHSLILSVANDALTSIYLSFLMCCSTCSTEAASFWRARFPIFASFLRLPFSLISQVILAPSQAGVSDVVRTWADYCYQPHRKPKYRCVTQVLPVPEVLLQTIVLWV